MDNAYYESMTEKMSELLGDFEHTSDENFIEVAKSIDIDSLYNITMNSCVALYRARYADGFDDTDPNQFSYIHNTDIIRQLRYNKAHEPVLYTATNPSIAYKEIEQPGNPRPFYLSVWTPEEKLNYSFLFNPQKCAKKSNAEKLASIMTDKIGDSTVGFYFLGYIGQLMEHSGNNYCFSSELASRIFKKVDAIVSVSAKSDRKELNITFSKDAVDKAVKMHYVLLCTGIDGSFFQVQKVGVLEGTSIVWYSIELDETSYHCEACANEKIESIWNFVKQNPSKMNPVFIDKIDGGRVKMLVGGRANPNFSYSYVKVKV